MSQSRNGLKLLVIGIDGAAYDVIRISQAGQRVEAITVPVTYPSWPINSFKGDYQMVRRRCELATKLLAKEDLDMMTVVFGATDRAHHCLGYL